MAGGFRSPSLAPLDIGGGVQRSINADPGVFVLTGADAELSKGVQGGFRSPSLAPLNIGAAPVGSYSLDADSGTFTLTGADSLADMSMYGESGSIALTGSDLGFIYGRQVAADEGAFALTGTATTFERTYNFPVDEGAFSLTGADATLTYTPVGSYDLIAETGLFSATGGAITFDRVYVLAADEGSFIVTGADTPVIATRILVSDEGAFVLTGADAFLNYSGAGVFSIIAEEGAFSFTGSDATLTGPAPVLTLTQADLDAISDAVFLRIVENGYSFEQMFRIALSALAGTSNKAGSTITFKGIDGVTDRIVGTYDTNNNRTGAILDGG